MGTMLKNVIYAWHWVCVRALQRRSFFSHEGDDGAFLRLRFVLVQGGELSSRLRMDVIYPFTAADADQRQHDAYRICTRVRYSVYVRRGESLSTGKRS